MTISLCILLSQCEKSSENKTTIQKNVEIESTIVDIPTADFQGDRPVFESKLQKLSDGIYSLRIDSYGTTGEIFAIFPDDGRFTLERSIKDEKIFLCVPMDAETNLQRIDKSYKLEIIIKNHSKFVGKNPDLLQLRIVSKYQNELLPEVIDIPINQ